MLTFCIEQHQSLRMKSNVYKIAHEPLIDQGNQLEELLAEGFILCPRQDGQELNQKGL